MARPIHHRLRIFVIGAGVLLLSAVLVACAPLPLSELDARGNTAAQAVTDTATAESGYPGPGGTPTPPLPNVSHNSLIATPLPGERVVAGTIVEIPETKDTFPYIYRREQATSTDGFSLSRLIVQYQGQEIRLGDDSGSSHLEATSEKYLTWRYLALHGDETNQPLKSGLYLYEIRNGQLTRIADGRRVGFSELDGEWVLYASWENARPTSQFPGGDTPGDLIPLLTYHIASGKTLTLSTSLPVILGRGTQSFWLMSRKSAKGIEGLL